MTFIYLLVVMVIVIRCTKWLSDEQKTSPVHEFIIKCLCVCVCAMAIYRFVWDHVYVYASGIRLVDLWNQRAIRMAERKYTHPLTNRDETHLFIMSLSVP